MADMVADMLADKKNMADMELDMVANMEVDKAAEMRWTSTSISTRLVNWAQTFSIRSLPVSDDDVDVNDGNADDIWKLLTLTLTGCHLSSDLSR